MLKLVDGFYWDTINLESDEFSLFLANNYVADDDEIFRFRYSKEFLQWSLCENYKDFNKEFNICVRADNGKLCATITGTPVIISNSGQPTKMLEINYLCIHKKLRNHRLAPVLIKEITRRANLQGYNIAIYTAGIELPKHNKVAISTYYHRSLNVTKLISINFIPPNSQQIELEKNTTIGWKRTLPQHIPQITSILNTYLSGLKIYPIFNEQLCTHSFLNRSKIISSFVVENNGIVTDFGSYFHLPSTIYNHPIYSKLYAAYSFYNVVTTISLKTLFNNLLVSAKSEEIDVFNALNIMDNNSIFNSLYFKEGSGNLNYYIFGDLSDSVKPEEIGIVLH
jgi:glycylpeptide N-tetradecanoyltransferase